MSSEIHEDTIERYRGPTLSGTLHYLEGFEVHESGREVTVRSHVELAFEARVLPDA